MNDTFDQDSGLESNTDDVVNVGQDTAGQLIGEVAGLCIRCVCKIRVSRTIVFLINVSTKARIPVRSSLKFNCCLDHPDKILRLLKETNNGLDLSESF